MTCPDKKAVASETERIRVHNDRLRQHRIGGRTVLTRAVASLAPSDLQAIFAAVQNFEAFTQSNDPWGEHDFGQVEVNGCLYFWKIDAYDLNLEYGSPDPADENVTCRVLTIMTEGDL